MRARYAAARGPFVCPACGKPNDAATGIADDGAVPAPGDVLVCIGCATPAVLGEDGALHPAPADVLKDLNVRRAVQTVHLSLLFPHLASFPDDLL